QLVLAPAGAGKTTALKVLADLWTAGGGHVLGLAPSAAAAAQLAEATGITADTLARLTWAIDHNQALPYWADRIGPRTLLLIDEAGMADTPTLDTAISHTLRQGGRVCLVGDDQQLGAIGAGGILADLQNTPARSGSPSCIASPTPTKPPPPYASATEHPTPSTSTPLVTGSGSATPTVCPTGCWPPGGTTTTTAWTR
ncbi:MAG: primase, partial [Propionibacteriaceae bacterium]|nr:primase [Propionibacteriaceae bacterium]